jgi:lysyl-tRNA synthetase class 1
MANEEDTFWADRMAEEIIKRTSYDYVAKIPKYSKFVVKTSASLSGVLHIGRLTDTVRSEAVYRALRDKGVKAEFIWVAEDMDPLRKVPEGIPKEYDKYIGMPVTDIPDIQGCHKTYADHFTEDYFKVLSDFETEKMTRYSMRAEYKKGTFRPYIKKILEHVDDIRGIVNKCKFDPETKLSTDWIPWKPLCEKCGKLMTTKFLGMEDGKVKYRCEDYQFEKFTAKGCGHVGLSDPMDGEGKLAWKSEWAMQWAYWNVVAEGAGKEYNLPNSAWFINAEICEKVFDFPAPRPIFYEYITTGGGGKMSASLGNVIFPKDWLKVAEPEPLRYLFLKKIGKAREFKWTDVPRLMDDYDEAAMVYWGDKKLDNEKESIHLKRLFEMSQTSRPKHVRNISYGFAAMIAQITHDPKKIQEILERSHHLKDMTPEEVKAAMRRIELSKNWVAKYAPPEHKFVVLKKMPDLIVNPTLKDLFDLIANKIGMPGDALQEFIYNTAKEKGIPLGAVFSTAYRLFLGKETGPRLGPFLASLDRDFVIKRLRMKG